MSESREDPIEFPTVAETARASPVAGRLTMTRPALPRIYATLERRLRELSFRQGCRPVPDGGRSLSPAFPE